MKKLNQNTGADIKVLTSTKSAFGKPRLLVLGCGDVGMHLLSLLQRRFKVFAVTSQAARFAELRAAGAYPVLANLDHPHTLVRISRLARIVVHLAPPQLTGSKDQRTRNLAAILPERTTLVYISTSSVYGDCAGRLVDETQPVNPYNARAQRRVDAEQVLRAWAKRRAGRLAILRVPGIYAADRLPLERLKKATPALCAADDVYTNHIHADDLAQVIFSAIFKAAPSRVYHAVDDSEMKMAAYFDAVAAAYGFPFPPRLPRTELAQQVSPILLSFMSESRRLQNQRMKAELGVRLRYPDVLIALKQMAADARSEEGRLG
ncbi:MAG: sugar nucleotide-binding protein [Glaciimonas sp.]|nr:sugar nucleotide-binding protein [Glaciimonas sp.]